MRSSRCAFNTAAALRRVFIAPIERPQPSQLVQKWSFASYAAFRQKTFNAPPATGPAKRRLPRDEEIKSEYVQIVSNDGKLSPPERTRRLLSNIDRAEYIVVAVAMPRQDRDRYDTSESDDFAVPTGGETIVEEGPQFPVVKVLPRKDFVAAERDRGKKKKSDNPTKTVKTIELNWAIDAHDLGHRLDKMKTFLTKGFRVEVMMAGKKKGRKATEEEAAGLVQRIRGVVGEVEGSKEWKQMEGHVGKQATLFIEGRVAAKE